MISKHTIRALKPLVIEAWKLIINKFKKKEELPTSPKEICDQPETLFNTGIFIPSNSEEHKQVEKENDK